MPTPHHAGRGAPGTCGASPGSGAVGGEFGAAAARGWGLLGRDLLPRGREPAVIVLRCGSGKAEPAGGPGASCRGPLRSSGLSRLLDAELPACSLVFIIGLQKKTRGRQVVRLCFHLLHTPLLALFLF